MTTATPPLLAKVHSFAARAGYSDQDIAAGVEHALRKARLSHPPGRFDRAGRFWCDEPVGVPIREPSRAYPHSQMVHARTAGHVARVFGAVELHVKRVARAIEAVDAFGAQPRSHHEALAALATIRRVLKPVGAMAKPVRTRTTKAVPEEA